jgi:2,4-dienoyl-CoA reductase-like NADH-dependent reductase (Old Yellow Enzyme family)
MSRLFQTLQLGDLQLPNRIVMAPLTRCRASAGRVPNALMAEYYVQRASAGLILSEATSISAQGVGYPDTPGIWSEQQIEGWAKITRAVQAAGGRMMLQLWHVGRVSDPLYLNGELPVAPSAIAPSGHVSLVRPIKPFVTPRALASEEITHIVADYRQAAINAKQAGFDGVEIHAANGYLLDQFLQDRSNQRSDEYGGSVENRARFLLQATDAAIDVWGAGRVGVHLAPRGDSHDMGDSDPLHTFGYVAEQLGQRGIAFIFTRESQQQPRISPQLKQRFGGVLIGNEGLDKAAAQQLLDHGEADAIAFGKDFIANPDLVRRLQHDAPLNAWDASTFYGSLEHDPVVGYTDYAVWAG